jgi:hypothetical protein
VFILRQDFRKGELDAEVKGFTLTISEGIGAIWLNHMKSMSW